jgi:hypothetical protein
MNREFCSFLVGVVAIGLMVCAPVGAQAELITWTTGDLGNNVIDDAGEFIVNPDLIDPSNTDPATLTVKYGLWNSPDVPVDVFLNGTLVGNFVADQGYISPGPEFAVLDVTGLLLNGLNTLRFTGNSVNNGDYVIGQVDLTYNSVGAVVPEPSTLASGFLGVTVTAWFLGRRRRASIQGS